MNAKEVVITCACGAGVIVRAGKGGVMTGKCPLCSRQVTATAISPISESTTLAPKQKGTDV